MQAPGSTILLVWGLFNDRCCTAQPLNVQYQQNSCFVPEDGWNPPDSLLQTTETTPVKQVSLGWTYALLLTEQRDAFVAQASQVFGKTR
jgi:hypothetical protein